jgi:hypothetical protein
MTALGANLSGPGVGGKEWNERLGDEAGVNAHAVSLWKPPRLCVRAPRLNRTVGGTLRYTFVTGPVRSIPLSHDPAAGVLLLSGVGTWPPPDGVG